MYRSWINGILGVWLIVLGYLGLPSDTKAILTIITGVILALGFFGKGAGLTVARSIEKESIVDSKEQEPEQKIKVV